MKKLLACLALVLASSHALAATNCPTDALKVLLGDFTGVATIVTSENSIFKIRNPTFFAPPNIKNQSSLTLTPENPCATFTAKIDYLNPILVRLVSGETVAREVKFFGVAENDGSFSLLVDGVKKGDLHKIDDLTFMARFDAPDPLNPKQLTFCKEFISVTPDLQQVVRTIQCFSKADEKLVEYRLVKEQRSSSQGVL